MNSIRASIRRRALGLLTFAGVLTGTLAGFAPPAAAQQLLQGDTATIGEDERSPFRGSLLFYGNTVSTKTLDKSDDLTYNPYYSMDLILLPRFWLSNTVFLRGILSISHEFTEPDETTYKNETFVGDTTIGIGSPLWTIPVLDIGTSGTFDFRLPTSKWSRGQDMLFAIQANVNFFRSFPVLDGLFLSYSLGMVRFFHEATTGSLEESPFGEESGDPRAAAATLTAQSRPDMYINNGFRNQRVRMMHTAALSLQIVPWLSTSASVTAMHDFLHPNIEENPQDSVAVDTNARDFMFYSAEVAVQPSELLGIALVANTFNPQLDPDPARTYYRPFFNRFTQLSAQLRFNVGSLL